MVKALVIMISQMDIQDVFVIKDIMVPIAHQHKMILFQQYIKMMMQNMLDY